MKYRHLFPLVVAFLAVMSCSEDFRFGDAADSHVELSANALYFSSEAGTQTLDIQAAEAWRAETDADWITLQNSEDLLTVTVTSNEEILSRSAKIRVISGNASIHAEVLQEAFHAHFVLGKSRLAFKAKASTVNLSFVADVPFRVITPEWLSVETGTGELLFSTVANTSQEPREDIVRFISGDDILASLPVRQAGAYVDSPLTLDIVFSDGTLASHQVLTPSLLSTMGPAYNLGRTERELTAMPGYILEFYSRGMTLVSSPAYGLRIDTNPRNYPCTNELRREDFAFIRFPGLPGRQLSKVTVITAREGGEACIGMTTGPDNAAAKASSASGRAVSLSAGRNEFILDMPEPDTGYYLLLPSADWEYRIFSIHLYYASAE